MFLRRDRARRLYASLHPWCRTEPLLVWLGDAGDTGPEIFTLFSDSVLILFEVLAVL